MSKLFDDIDVVTKAPLPTRRVITRKDQIIVLLKGGTIANVGRNGLRLRDHENHVVCKIRQSTLDYLTKRKILKRYKGLYSISKRAVQHLHGRSFIKQQYRKLVK